MFQEYDVDYYFLHPNYTDNFENNIALLHVEKPIAFSRGFYPILLPKLSQRNSTFGSVDAFFFRFFGLPYDNTGNYFEKAKVISHKECIRNFGIIGTICNDNVLCTISSKCDVDGGSALVIKEGRDWVLVGGLSLRPLESKNRTNVAISSKVTNYFDWIK